jgi:hypothetical protein
MPKFRFNDDDMMGRRQLTPAWRELEILSITEEQGKTDPTSTNYVVKVVVSSGEDAKVQIMNWFSTTKEPGRGNFAHFLTCFIQGKPDKTKDYDLDMLKGRKIEGYCRYNLERGWNEVTDWRAVKAQAEAK